MSSSAVARVCDAHRTVGAALRAAGADLAARPAARLEAEVLLAHVLGLDRAGLLGRVRDAIEPDALGRLRALVDRRAAGEPLAYLVGRAAFHGIDLEITRDVLVPRPETEMLVDWALDRLARRREQTMVLDVGTGSGAVALSIAAATRASTPAPRLEATDVSESAVALAVRNARRLGLEDRVVFHRADLLPSGSRRFDLVVANLPYVGTDEIADVDLEVLRWEPHEALFGGSDGLDIVRRLLSRLPERVSLGAAIGIEIGWRQGAEARRLARRAFAGAAIEIRQDLSGRDRVLAIACAA